MTGYEIRNAIRRAYGIDAADHLFETDDDRKRDSRSALARLFMTIAMAMKGTFYCTR